MTSPPPSATRSVARERRAQTVLPGARCRADAAGDAAMLARPPLPPEDHAPRIMPALTLATPEAPSGIAAAAASPAPASPTAERAYGLWALAAVAAITAARLVWLAISQTDLYPDEAQYWFWAQHPAFG